MSIFDDPTPTTSSNNPSTGGIFGDPSAQQSSPITSTTTDSVSSPTPSNSIFSDPTPQKQDNGQVDTSNSLSSVNFEDPLSAVQTVYKGALNDIGNIASGIGKILWSPVQVTENMIQGNPAFQNTIMGNMGDILTGAVNNMTGNGSSDAWDAIKSYYGQYGTHPIDMIANHPINTLLDVASILDFGSTAFGAVAKTGEVGDLIDKANVLQKAGEFDEADKLAQQASTLRSSSFAGKISDGLASVSENINPFTAASKLVGGTASYLGSKIPALDAFNNWVQHFTNRNVNLGLEQDTGNRFTQIADQLNSQKELYNQSFRDEIEPVLQPLVNNTPLADKIAEDLDRPGSANLSPSEQVIRDQIQSIFDKHVTEPERAGGILKNWIDGGYLEHVYEEPSETKGFFGKVFNSFKVNAKNDKAAQILRFDDVNNGSIVYRGGSENIDNSKIGSMGVSVTTDKNIAENFRAPENGIVDSKQLSPNAKILKDSDIPSGLKNDYLESAKELSNPNNFSKELQQFVLSKQQAIVDFAKNNGYDGVEFPFENEIRIINPDVLNSIKEPIIGTADYNNYKEVNKDAEIEKIENAGNSKISALQKENTQLTKGKFDSQLEDILNERKALLAQKASLSERQIAHPEDFQTDIGDVGNALDIQYKATRQALIDNNLRLQDEIAKLQAKVEAGTLVPGKVNEVAGVPNFANDDDHLAYNMQKIQDITNKIAEDSKPYNTNLRLFKDGDGNLLQAIRPTRSELLSIGMKPKDLINSLDHRMNTSAMNQAKAKIGDQIGQEFGQIEKPNSPLTEDGDKWVKSSSLKNSAGQAYYVPQSIEDATSRYFTVAPKGDAITALHAVNTWFKKFLFANPLSGATHEIHLAYLGALGGIDPLDILRTIKGLKDGDAIAARFNGEVGKTSFGGGLLEQEADSMKGELENKAGGLKTAVTNAINPTSGNFLGMNVTSHVLENTDDFLRQTLLRKALKNGATWDEAMSTAQKFMGNYANMTPFEKNLQAVFPFYNWMKQSIPASARALTSAAPQLDFARIFGGSINPNSEEQAGKFNTGMKDNKGNEVYANAPIPLKDIRNMFLDAPDFMWSRLNPAITVPADLAANSKEPFNRDPNFTTLNRIIQPDTSAFDPYNVGQELQFAGGQIANPIRVFDDQSGTTNTTGWSKQALEGLGIYESSYNPVSSQYYSVADATKAITSLRASYNKAVKNNNLPQASFYQTAIRKWQAQIQQGNQ